MAYGLIIPRRIAAKNVDAMNRSAVSAAAYENGSVGNLLTKSSTAGESEVWVLTAPVTGALTNLWMMYEPEVVLTLAKYKGIDPDPRNFRKEIGEVFSVFRPQLGDLITMTADAVTGTKSTNTWVVATNTAQKLTWAAAAVSGLSLKLIEDDFISIGLGSIGTQRVAAYLFEVQALA